MNDVCKHTWNRNLHEFQNCLFEIEMHCNERKNCLNLFGTKKFVLVLQPKRIFLCNKEKYIWFQCPLLYFKEYRPTS